MDLRAVFAGRIPATNFPQKFARHWRVVVGFLTARQQMADKPKTTDAKTGRGVEKATTPGRIVVRLPKPNPEQQEYIEKLRRSTSSYDPHAVIRGRRIVRP